MKPQEAINEKYRNHGVPTECYACKHSYNDVEEGWNCNKYDAIITLSSGSTLMWPGQATDRAYNNDCRGNGFERSAIPAIVRKYPLAHIIGATLFFIVMLFLIWHN